MKQWLKKHKKAVKTLSIIISIVIIISTFIYVNNVTYSKLLIEKIRANDKEGLKTLLNGRLGI